MSTPSAEAKGLGMGGKKTPNLIAGLGTYKPHLADVQHPFLF